MQQSSIKSSAETNLKFKIRKQEKKTDPFLDTRRLKVKTYTVLMALCFLGIIAMFYGLASATHFNFWLPFYYAGIIFPMIAIALLVGRGIKESDMLAYMGLTEDEIEK